MEVASTEKGTIFGTIGLPWPPSERVLFEQVLQDGAVSLSQMRDGCLRFDVSLDESGSRMLLDSGTTGPVIPRTDNRVVVSAMWENSRIVDVRVNAKTMFSRKIEATIIQQLELDAPTTSVGRADFTDKNDQAKVGRARQLASWRRDPSRTQEGPEYAFTALTGELMQVEDLLQHVRSGKKHHLPGLMARIRLLLIGQPMGLLQMCAAFVDAELIAYTGPYPDTKLDFQVSGFISFNILPQPERVLDNPIDLDVWLRMRTAGVGERVYTNRDIIREIGNTIGSHLDLDVQDSVLLFRSSTVDVDQPMDNITRYVLQVSETVLALGKQLIASREKPR